MSLTISQNHYNEILTEPGYPIITPNLLELTETQIKDLLIWPALREFWKWFPIVSEQQIQASSTFEVDFPNPETFGVVDVRLTTSAYRGSGVTANPLINETNIKVSRGGRYGTRNNYEHAVAMYVERLERVSAVEYQKVFRVRILNRKVKGYTNTLGVISIIWADYSEDFNDVPFEHISEVIKLASANILRYLGMLRNQDTSDLPNEMNGDEFISRADDLEEEIIEDWKAHTKAVLIRS